jgi:molybdate transport system permease protein
MSDWAPLWLSLQVAVAGLALAIAVGLPLALLLARVRFPGRDLLEVLVAAPLVLPPTVLGYYVLVALGRGSPLGRLYEQVVGSPLVFSRAGCVVAATVAALPFVVKGSRSAIEGVDAGLLGAASTLGAGWWRRLVTVLLPLAGRGIAGGAMLGFAKALGDFGVTLMVAGNIPGRTQTAPLAIYDQFLAGRDQSALGLVLALTAVGVGLLWVVNRWGDPGRREART